MDPESPFGDLERTNTPANRQRMRFITTEMSLQVLDACINDEWRLAFAMGRWGGLRVPSELLGMRWVDEGAEFVFSPHFRDADRNLRTTLVRTIEKAGLPVWPKPWHNLRASRETELCREHLLQVVVEWIGNMAKVAQKHSLQVTDADFEKAVQNPVHSTHRQAAAEGSSNANSVDTTQATHSASQGGAVLCGIFSQSDSTKRLTNSPPTIRTWTN